MPAAGRGNGRGRGRGCGRGRDRRRVARRVLRRRSAVPRLGRLFPRGDVGERARRPRGDVVGDVGEHQRDPQFARRAARPIDVRAARLPRLGTRPGRDRLGPRRRDDEPRRHLAFHRARPLARARRPDRAPPVDPPGRRVGERGLGRDAALLRRVRVVPPHVPPRRRRLEGARILVARPAVPAVGLPRTRRGGNGALRSRPDLRPPRSRQ